MRQIGTLGSELQASRFRALLRSRGIEAQVEPAGAAWAIWVYDEDRVGSARELLAEFSCEPNAERYAHLAHAQAEAARSELDALLAARRRHLDRAWPVRYPISLVPVTFAVIVLCGIATFATRFGADQSAVGLLTLSRWQATSGWIKTPLPEIRDGEVWRLLTPCLLHFDPLHLLGNALWFYLLGRMVEFRLGRWRYIGLLVLLGVVSNLTEGLLVGPAFGGLSGVVCGLFGYVWCQTQVHPETGYQLSTEAAVYFLVWNLLCLVGVVGDIANTAHVSGLALGALLALPRWDRASQ